VGKLLLVATPIGNLEDISRRALRALGEARLIAAEDTRHTAKLLQRYNIHTPLISYHEHNKRQRQDRLLSELAEGDLALVSDAGTPGLSDPGYELVQAALQAGFEVSPIPGPSAPMAALVASGLPTDSFIFVGYLPRRASDRRQLLDGLKDQRRTLLFFEVPHRLLGSLQDMAQIFGADRRLAVCRELTKVHEQILRQTIGEARRIFSEQAPRGEFTLVVEGAPPPERWSATQVQQALARQLAAGSTPAQAARQVSRQAGWPRSQVYRLALEEEE
jgi:16S rRNA (cytidine1402-2'-O)-methyltransferase